MKPKFTTERFPFFAPSSLCLFLLLLLGTHRSVAQQSSISIVGGVFQTQYDFVLNAGTVYPNSSFIFPWEGKYTKTNALFGLDLNRSVSEHWQIKTGLRLFLTGYRQEKDLKWGSEFTGNGYEPLLPNERLVINHLFLEVPLALRYFILVKKFAPYLEAGISTNYYLTTQMKQRIEGNEATFFDNDKSQINLLNFALKLGIGLQYRLAGKHGFFVQPVIYSQLKSVEKVSRNPGPSFGLEAGWQIQLKN